MCIRKLSSLTAAAVGLLCALSPLVASAVSPASILEGKSLFERKWQPRNPALGSDGLGPLFDSQSCAGCHHQGGIGGGGDAQYNAKSLGIESMQIVGGPVSDDVLAQVVRSFHPGFISKSGQVEYRMPVPHHGGSPLYQNTRAALLSQIDSKFTAEGGPSEASEVRRATDTAILFNNQVGNYKASIRARLFHRNTTPLFGLGLIDRVTGRQLEQQVKAQLQHPEISGRISTLDDGRYGAFGWRANVPTLLEYVDLACAKQVGLETKRRDQPNDPTNPEYRNPSFDLRDDQLRAIRDFIVALPPPTRKIPYDSHGRVLATRGEQVFGSTGCAVCHVPIIGPAEGVYSDLLLHDMGSELSDLNHAQPHLVRATQVRNVFGTETSKTKTDVIRDGRRQPTRYSTTFKKRGRSARDNRDQYSRYAKNPRFAKNDYYFQAPTGPPYLFRIINPRTMTGWTQTDHSSDSYETVDRCNIEHVTITDSTTTRTTKAQMESYIRLEYERTNYNQEWRTPPLWGVADSGPYMHDGRAETLLEAIAMHDGESAATRDRFLNLSLDDRHAVVAFLNTLVAPTNAPQQD